MSSTPSSASGAAPNDTGSEPIETRGGAGVFADIADALLAVTLAPRCAVCALPLDHPTGGPVCSQCWFDARLGGPIRSAWSPGPVHVSISLGEYEGALRDIIHAFKYEARRSLGVRLGAMMRDVAWDLLRDAHCAVPVPLHPWRRLRRGFNQAADLAHTLGVAVAPALWRTRATRSQLGLPARARRANMQGAFRLSPLLSQAAIARSIEGRIVVLVDDVTTTGATLDACAQVLEASGAREIRALTAAKTSSASALRSRSASSRTHPSRA